MKKTQILTLIAAVLLTLASCKPIDDPQQQIQGVMVTTAEPTFITSISATCGAEVTADDAGPLLELGVCWSKTEKPTINDQISKPLSCSQSYQCIIGNLEPNTEYHVRGFAKYGSVYCYGEEKTFTTLSADTASTSHIIVTEPYDISPYGFCANVIINPLGISTYRVGMYYSTNPEFPLDDSVVDGLGFYNEENNIYEVCCYDLIPNTKYYYRAIVSYYFGGNEYYFLGDIFSITIPDIPFELELFTDYPHYNSLYGILYIDGEVSCTKPHLLDQVGICYSSTNEYPQYDTDLHTNVNPPIGNNTYFDFRCCLENLSPQTKYYIRSYARYMSDSIKYGNVRSFDTY